MASAALPGPDGMTTLIETINKTIYTFKYGSQRHTARQHSMYPGIPSNPFVVGENEHDHEFEDEAVVSPLTSPRTKSAWHPDTWIPDRLSRGYEYDNEAHGHAHSTYATQVEDPTESIHFDRVRWNRDDRDGQQSRVPISSAEEFRLQGERRDDGLGIQVTDFQGGEFNNEKSWEPKHPPATAYRPNTRDDFEDVELNKPHEKTPSTRSKKKRFCTENNFRITLWALVLILPFVVLPLTIFGGVYHWGNAEGLCKAGGGSWENSDSTCHY